jgi:hypothetical protein
VQRVNPLALEWARPLTRMRAPSHGRTSDHLAKRGPGLSPCFQVKRCGRCSPSHITHRMHVYCAWGKGFAHRLHRRATPGAGGPAWPHRESCCCRNKGAEECKTPAIRRFSGLPRAEAALRAAARTSGSVVPPPACAKGSCNTRSRRCLRCRLAMGCLAAGESPDTRFHPSAFSVGMDPRGSRALAHTPGRPDPSAGTIPQLASSCPCGCCSTRRPDAGGP